MDTYDTDRYSDRHPCLVTQTMPTGSGQDQVDQDKGVRTGR